MTFYRVYDVENNTYLDQEQISLLPDGGIMECPRSTWRLMENDSQYVIEMHTDLFDRDGEPILEGDIVECQSYPSYPSSPKVKIAVLSTLEFLFNHCNPATHGYESNNMKVIGNIHDEPWCQYAWCNGFM